MTFLRLIGVPRGAEVVLPQKQMEPSTITTLVHVRLRTRVSVGTSPAKMNRDTLGVLASRSYAIHNAETDNVLSKLVSWDVTIAR